MQLHVLDHLLPHVLLECHVVVVPEVYHMEEGTLGLHAAHRKSCGVLQFDLSCSKEAEHKHLGLQQGASNGALVQNHSDGRGRAHEGGNGAVE